jgi:predicted ABC-type ATPase
MPQLFMLGGPNGAGKTTSAMKLLPDFLRCKEYVNADSIAAGLSPFSPESTALQAGRLMVKRIHHLAQQKNDFSFETTMASRSFVTLLQKCKQQNYNINLIFLWLQTPLLAIKRIEKRVQDGGHNIPNNIVLRRYKRGIKNFLNLYSPIADSWILYDNSNITPIVIAQKLPQKADKIFNKNLWTQFKESSL